jgi:hypothetical protein
MSSKSPSCTVLITTWASVACSKSPNFGFYFFLFFYFYVLVTPARLRPSDANPEYEKLLHADCVKHVEIAMLETEDCE